MPRGKPGIIVRIKEGVRAGQVGVVYRSDNTQKLYKLAPDKIIVTFGVVVPGVKQELSPEQCGRVLVQKAFIQTIGMID